MCIKWEQSTSSVFTVLNDVRQGIIFSPRLFAVYVDDLSNQLSNARSECLINHVIYADDICQLAPSVLGLQKLLEMCYDFSHTAIDHRAIHNSHLLHEFN